MTKDSILSVIRNDSASHDNISEKSRAQPAPGCRGTRMVFGRLRDLHGIELWESEFEYGTSAQRSKLLGSDDPLIQHVLNYDEWVNRVSTPILERNEHSRAHLIVEAFIADSVCFPGFGKIVEIGSELKAAVMHPFVVKHDWARAFANASGMGEEFRLPYSTCLFEFRVSGKSVDVIAVDDGNGNRLIPLVQAVHNFWMCVDEREQRERELMRFLREQIRAACYALDSELATQTIVRQPPKLNAKRKRYGRVPMSDYHVVDVMRKAGSRSSSDEKVYQGCVRLHFRRGHWRHLEGRNIWVKACLVGNPELGRIDKEYRL